MTEIRWNEQLTPQSTKEINKRYPGTPKANSEMLKYAPHSPKRELNGLLGEHRDRTRISKQSLENKVFFYLPKDRVLNQKTPSSFHTKSFSTPKTHDTYRKRCSPKGCFGSNLPHPLTHPKTTPLKNKQQVGAVSSHVLVLHCKGAKHTFHYDFWHEWFKKSTYKPENTAT